MTVTVAGYSGDAGDAMCDPVTTQYSANDSLFSSPDVDNDQYMYSCAGYHASGWGFEAWLSTMSVFVAWLSTMLAAGGLRRG